MKLLFFIIIFCSLTVFAKDENFQLEIRQCRDKDCKVVATKAVQYNFKELLDTHSKTPPPEIANEIKIDGDIKFVHFGYLQPKKVGYRKTVFTKIVKLQILNGKKVLDSKKLDLDANKADAELSAGLFHYQVKIESK